MQPVFSEAKLIRGKFGDEYELTVSGCRDKLFQTWVQQTADAELCAYFRAVSDDIAQRNLDDYHFKICNGRYNSRTRSQTPQWSITILYGGQNAEGPLLVSRCMSCDMDCPLILGVLGEQQQTAAAAAADAQAAGLGRQQAAADSQLPQAADITATDAAHGTFQSSTADARTAEDPRPAAGSTEAATRSAAAAAAGPQQQQQQQGPVSRDSLLQETEHTRVWLDAKARPMFVITPKKHLEQLSDLSDAELSDLFRTAASIAEDMGCHSVNTMVLNHGDNRNHAHLHLKVRIHEPEFEKAAVGWSPQHKAQLELLRSFRDSLPAEKRGTREAFALRMRQKQQQQERGQRGQYQQRQQPWTQQRPFHQQHGDEQQHEWHSYRGRGRGW